MLQRRTMLHGDVLGERARLTPEATALVLAETGERFTYRELDRRAARCAALYSALGLVAGERAAVLSGNSVEFLDLFFAAGKSGVVLVPLNSRATAKEHRKILADCEASALFYEGGDDGEGGFAETAAALADVSSLRYRLSFEELLRRTQNLPDVSVPGSGSTARPDPEDPYCLLYTSGTTGWPKGVVIPHRMIAWNGYNTVVGWGLRADDVSPVFTPLYHAGGLGAFLVPIFTVGGTVVLHYGFDAVEVLRTLERERCTVILGVPTILRMLAETPEFETADLSHVRWFISGGAPLPESVLDLYRRRGLVLRQGYGLTEVGVNCFAMTDEEAVDKAGSIGKPMMFTEARVVGEEGEELPPGEVGELCFRGPHVSTGYWNDPEATAAARDEDGWFHTGDLARRDDDGFYYMAGRKKEMFISGGVNVYPAEIEAELAAHPEVADVAVVGVADAQWGEVGVAFWVPREAPGPDPGSLVAYLQERLARYKIPKRFVRLEELPRTPYGKVVKGELRDH
jgi:fatty-acyl-CoA synthase